MKRYLRKNGYRKLALLIFARPIRHNGSDVTGGTVAFYKMADDSSSLSSSSDSSDSGSEMILECETDEEIDVIEGVQPYLFEPESVSLPASENNESSDEELAQRTVNNNWCQCGEHCQRQDTERECVCCQEIEKVTNRNIISADKRHIPTPQCITQNPGFLVTCTDVDVLETAWYSYRQQFGGFDGPEHKRLRHIAYRQFVRWCWGWLGRHIRVVLPACVVSCIRAHFPPPGLEENFLFEGFHFPDD